MLTGIQATMFGAKPHQNQQGILSINLPLAKMTAILADDLLRCISVNEKFCILIKKSLKFVPDVQNIMTQHWFR